MDRNHTVQIIVVKMYTVALRKESVDRNLLFRAAVGSRITSLSARRAWIEIGRHRRFEFFYAVALRKESVDRNSKIAKKVLTSM